MSKIVVFYDRGFPYDGERPTEPVLQALGRHAIVADARRLTGELADAASLVHLHGAYFPKDAWSAILAHLRQGKGLVAIGGAPFKRPVVDDGPGGWRIEPEQTAYHQQLHIQEALPIDPADIASLESNGDIPLFAGKEKLFAIEPTCGLVLHVTRYDDQPGQGGSGGPMDAHIYPLLRGISGDGRRREVAAPAVLLENTKGDYVGGRWIFVNQRLTAAFWAHSQEAADALREWAAFAARGVTELWLKPNYASYEPDDRAVLILQSQRLGPHRGAGIEWAYSLRVLKAKQSAAAAPDYAYPSERFDPVYQSSGKWIAARELGFERIRLPFAVEAGFYAVIVELTGEQGERRTLRQGFWGFDADLLRNGEMLTTDRDYFRKEGRPLPIVGMTYMTSDVARKFLWLPNAAVWDRDMAQMKRAGVNMIRTGIWTAWRHVMFADGHPSEEVLRALDAFFLTAKRYGLEVVFNFFAFTPEAWEGENPYLDPRSIEAQKRFIAAVVSRHKDSAHVHWDLINEPSLFDPKRIFSGPRSGRDRFEQAAFAAWLRERHGALRTLQERWNMTPDELPGWEAVRLPEPAEMNFNTTETLEKRGGPWLDYTLFTMEMHNRWAGELVATIRSLQPRQLVTVGQDEALSGQRPSPFFYADVVDYTTVHSWWNMDALAWDGIFAKTPDRPNLVQETGIMYVETPDGRAKRSERELRNILERKYAYAFAAGGAGAVQWIWNTNCYMHNINESNIGALRADGTEKPEAIVTYQFGAFMARIRDLFEEREPEPVLAVFPYSNDFSTRKLAYEATTKLVRTLSYEMNVHVRGIGEYQLASLSGDRPKLIIVPSAHNFSDEALERLLVHIRARGGALLLTGPVGLDAYWRPTGRLADVLHAGAVRNVLREEALRLGDRQLAVSFGGPRIADVAKQEQPSEAIPYVQEVALGAGRLLWCPLPIELNERAEPLREVYRHALETAGVGPELEWLRGGTLPGVYGRKLQFRDGALYIFVSEYGLDARIEVKDPLTGKIYAFDLASERSVMFACDRQGELTAVCRPEEVEIDIR